MQYHHSLQTSMVDFNIFDELFILVCSIIFAFIFYLIRVQQVGIECMKALACTLRHALTVNFNISTKTIWLLAYFLMLLYIKTDQLAHAFLYIRFSKMTLFFSFVILVIYK